MNLIIKIRNLLKPKKGLKCPHCGNNKWIEGPGGGSFGNIKCDQCNHKYNNLGVFGLQKID